jgi:hypothetical protein
MCQPEQVVHGQGQFLTTPTAPILGGNWMGDGITGSMSLDLARVSFTRLDGSGRMYLGERKPSHRTDVIRWDGTFGRLQDGAIEINHTPIQVLITDGSWTATTTNTVG